MNTSVRAKDRAVLRDLAQQYMDVCQSDRNRASRELWRKHNSLGKTRPPVVCSVFFASHFEQEIDEALPPLETSGDLREVELWLRRRLWAATIPDDSVFDPWYSMPAILQRPRVGNWGVALDRVNTDVGVGYRYMPVIRTLEDLRKLEATPHRILDPNPPAVRRVRDIFGDILPVHVNRSTIYPIWGGTDLSEAAGAMLGLTELMYLILLQPELVHRLMAFMRDAVLANLEQGEAAGDWSSAENQNYGMPPDADGLPEPTANSHGLRLKDLWFFTHAQEFEGTSPAQHEEFLLQYQLPIMERFGLVNYGCCETLDRKIDLLRKIPNLRRICVGPRARVSLAAEQIRKDYIISWRPNPAMVSFSFDPAVVRKAIRQALMESQGCKIELMLKEILTVQYDLSRIFKWAEIAREEAERFAP